MYLCVSIKVNSDVFVCVSIKVNSHVFVCVNQGEQ
jgi:hypothetical protein